MMADNGSFNLRSISNSATEPLGKHFKDIAVRIFTWDWIFSKWYEKIIVISALLWGIYSLGKLLWSIL